MVEERYGVRREDRTFKSEVEYFQVARPLAALPPGKRLQVLDAARFRVVWSVDGWTTTHHTEARLIGYPGFGAELPLPAGANGTLELTLFWPGEERWLGRNYQIKLLEQ